MSFWRRGDRPHKVPAGSSPAVPRHGAGPGPRPTPEEALLHERLAAVADDAGEHAAPPLDDAGTRAAIEALITGGHARRATLFLERALVVRPDEHGLRLRLAELLCDRMDHAAALPHLEPLVAVPACAARARFLLAEAAERAGSPQDACTQYELLLADDLDHPRARARHARLREVLAAEGAHDGVDADAPGAPPTLLGVEGSAVSLGGRYRLRREIGRGATGAVYLALDEELGVEVALKLLHAGGWGRSARASAFNEARIAAALHHPGVVAIYDLDEEHSLIAMELGAGTLRDRLAAGPLPPLAAVGRARELFDTLAAVHRAGVMHRDLKPGNLLFRRSPLAGDAADLVLGDFGLAHPCGATDGGTPGGTLAYLAPEARAGEHSPAGDVYAGGVILLEMLGGALPASRAAILAGDRPFAGELPSPVVTALGAGPARRLAELLAAMLDGRGPARPTSAATRSALARIDEEVRAAR